MGRWVGAKFDSSVACFPRSFVSEAAVENRCFIYWSLGAQKRNHCCLRYWAALANAFHPMGKCCWSHQSECTDSWKGTYNTFWPRVTMEVKKQILYVVDIRVVLKHTPLMWYCPLTGLACLFQVFLLSILDICLYIILTALFSKIFNLRI